MNTERVFNITHSVGCVVWYLIVVWIPWWLIMWRNFFMCSLSIYCKIFVCSSLLPNFLMYYFSFWFTTKQHQFSSVQLLSRVQLFVTPWTAARQASLSINNSRSLPKPVSIESVMPSNHLILWCPLLLLPSIFPSIRVFSNELALPIRWPKYQSFSFNISPSNEHPGLISFRMDWLDLLAVQGSKTA